MPPERGARRYVDVELRGANLHRDGRPVLRGIDWRVRPGERWVVLGANGAGKTQLLKLLAGAVWPDPARRPVRRYRWGGERHDTPQAVLAEIAYLGPERQDRYSRYEWNFSAAAVVGTGLTRSDIPQGPLTRAQRRRVAALLRRLGVAQLARRRFLTLSFGERRLVLLARALAIEPRLLLLDELLGGLDAVNRARLLRWLESSGRSARPWVLSSHRIEEVPAAATHLLRLERGRIVERRRLRGSAVTTDALPGAAASEQPAARRQAAAHGHGRRGDGPGGGTARAARPPRPAPDALVELRNASVFVDHAPVLRQLSLRVGPGECWVVHGANGAGKTTLLRAIYGDYPAARGGRILREGVVPGVPLDTFRDWCAIVAPYVQGEYPRNTPVLEVVVSGLRSSYGLDAPPTRAERAAALRALRLFGLGSRAAAPLATLSYGQARRVLFARAWVREPRLLLLDEALGGIDQATRRLLGRRIAARVRAGAAVVMTTHHRDEWPDCTTHELELRQGRGARIGPVRGHGGR
ncbi:MAG: ATP-binding cassette domain-containing protein [Steroidobacteraceae bacterium]